MSKCKEAYETLFAEPWMHERERSNLWKAAWNARGERCIEICNNQAEESSHPEQAYFCAEAIEQEQCE